jgi:hypothetical protein
MLPQAASLCPAPPHRRPSLPLAPFPLPEQHLSLLLAAPSSDVVLATLQTLAAFVRKSSSPTTRCALPPAPALLPAPPPAVTAPHSCVERVRPPARC